jgi:hypothetical protein
LAKKGLFVTMSGKTSMQIIADYFNGHEVKAINFCRRVNNYITPHARPKLIANTLAQYPHLKDSPEKLAEKMAQKYQHLSFHPVIPKASPPETSKISHHLILEVAKFIKSKGEPPVQIARLMLTDLEHISSYMKRANEKQIIRAFRQASEAGEITLDSVDLELRRILFRYHGDPDYIHIISTPMGGKPNKRET